MNYEAPLRTHQMFRFTSVWDQRFSHWKVEKYTVCSVHLICNTQSGCPPIPSPQVTKHCFWHLSYPNRVHKSSWTWTTHTGSKNLQLLWLPSFSWIVIRPRQSQVWWSGFGHGAPIVFREQLMPTSDWLNFEVESNFPLTHQTGQDTKNPGTDFWAGGGGCEAGRWVAPV